MISNHVVYDDQYILDQLILRLEKEMCAFKAIKPHHLLDRVMLSFFVAKLEKCIHRLKHILCGNISTDILILMHDRLKIGALLVKDLL